MKPAVGAVSFVLRVGWLSRLPLPLRSALLDVAWVRNYSAGETLYAGGDPSGGLYGLESGCLALEGVQSDSPPQKSFLVHPGAWIGEGPVCGLETRMIGASATRASAVVAIEVAACRRVAARAPDLWRHIALLSLRNHARTIGLAQDLMLRGSRERLAALLARLAGLRDAHPPVPLVIDATQGEIAAIANLSRSVVSSLLLKMELDGLVRLRRASVEILDVERLLATREAAAGAERSWKTWS
ncbi:MAG TPA: Crp/Fnr family transcriptional regulator [Paracoccaceae bacterium]|nr:Crp/Fnr family transcriptional regulator [Paracoccaceae bacterium]